MPDTVSGDELDAPSLRAVIEVQTEIARLGVDLGAIMELVAERARALTAANAAAVELAEGEDMVYRAASGSARAELGLHIARNASLSGLCLREGRPLVCTDAEQDPRVDLAACRRVGLRSMIVVPLAHAGQPIGVLKVMSPLPAAFAAKAVHLLEALSGMVAAAMYHGARLSSDELLHRATHDPLCGLPNRALFHEQLHRTIAQARRTGSGVGTLVIDMDGLKQINDTLGHRAGDAAIREFARRLREAAREGDTVARLGGDEFAAILPVVADRTALERAVTRMGERLDGLFVFEGESLAIGASVGGALYPDDGDCPDRLLEHADRAMYAAKRARKAATVERTRQRGGCRPVRN